MRTSLISFGSGLSATGCPATVLIEIEPGPNGTGAAELFLAATLMTRRPSLSCGSTATHTTLCACFESAISAAGGAAMAGTASRVAAQNRSIDFITFTPRVSSMHLQRLRRRGRVVRAAVTVDEV